jgi:hypothetical protein
MTDSSGPGCAGRSSLLIGGRRSRAARNPLIGEDSMLDRSDIDKRKRVREAVGRHRARRKKCRASYHCDVDGSVLDMLVRRKYIEDHETDDPLEVSAAITLFLADHAKADAVTSIGSGGRQQHRFRTATVSVIRAGGPRGSVAAGSRYQDALVISNANARTRLFFGRPRCFGRV